jgi:hypothetical protein
MTVRGLLMLTTELAVDHLEGLSDRPVGARYFDFVIGGGMPEAGERPAV